MRCDVVTIFPDVFPGPLGVGVVGRALGNQLEVVVHDLREWGIGPRRQVDDMAFGGGPGMVLRPEPLISAVRHIRSTSPQVRTILMTPKGRPLTQQFVHELSQEDHLAFFCGRYQGVDERAAEEIGEGLSVGEYILSGGEIAAMAVIEAVARLLPGVVGSEGSLDGETHGDGEVEPPLYTRPAVFDGREVPAVLREGNHRLIEEWKESQRVRLRQSRD